MTIADRFRRRRLVAALALAALAAGGAATTAGAISGSEKLTGGGFIGDPNLRVSLSVNLSCAATGPGSELQIHTIFEPLEPDEPLEPVQGAFQLERLEQATCTGDLPVTRNDGGTHKGDGTGTCKTQGGSSAPARVEWSLTDGGIRDGVNRPDSLQLKISSTRLPACDLEVKERTLENGNFRMVEQQPPDRD